MKNRKILLAILLASLLVIATICVLLVCIRPTATVTFYNGSEVYETIQVKKGAKLTLPEAPKAEKGKGLAGWTTIDGDMEEVIDPAAFVVDGDISLYALWADVYTVVINADNGTPFTVKEVIIGTTIEQPEDPVKEGFRFVEWRDALNDTSFDFSKPIYSDLTIKAMYGDGAPNRVSDTKWDFSSGIHGSWIGAQGGWNYQINGLPAADMVYQTTEEGYAAWGFTLTDSLENIPVVDGKNGPGLGMKYIYNEGISVEASKAKLVVVYLKPKYFPIDMATSPNDQFRISVLTSNGGMIYGYGAGSEAWALRTDAASERLIQVDQMEDGWIRVQFKIHKLDVWSEDAIIKGMAISFVQRKATPVMDIISVKSIELLDQEEFVDPHQVDYVTKSEWDMRNKKDAADWTGYHAKKENEALTTTVTSAGMAVKYQSPGNGWKGIVLEKTSLEISKLTGKLTFTYSSDMAITSYRLHILTDMGGSLTANGTADSYVSVKVSDIDAGRVPSWTRSVNADGSVTVTVDLSSFGHFANGEELKGLTIVTVTANKIAGTVTYKSIALEKNLEGHNCQVDGHFMKEATCTEPKTCYVCGATEGEADKHSWEAATCQTPKTCSYCRAEVGTVSSHRWKAATCQTPKTCSVCGKKEGTVSAHSYAEGFCSVCGIPEVIRTEWDMSNKKAAADWTGYHAKKENEALTTTVTSAGMAVNYQSPGNGWKGIVLEKTLIETSKLTGKLTFTYSSDMAVTSYRIHILTNLGGKLTANGTDDCYTAVNVSDIKAGSLAAWTQTTNADGSVTVTFDLSSMRYFAKGTALKGLTIVTVTANNTTGTVTYKSIELERDLAGHDCQADGHIMKEATCTEPKTCYVCGATEGEPAGHTWKDATCTEPKTCSICSVTEGEPAGHTWVDATCLAPKTCSVCGATEGELGNHVDANADDKCDNCGVDYCAVHTWIDASCFAPKTCTVCGATEGKRLAHTDADKDHVCDVCAGGLSVWYMNKEEDASQWYCAQAYTEVRPTRTYSEITEAGFTAYYGHQNAWKGIILKNVEIDIAKLSGLLSFTYNTKDLTFTEYRIHVLTDKGGDLGSNTSGTPSNYYVAVKIADIAQSTAWTRTENADGTVTVTFDLKTLPYFAEGTVLMGMDIVTVAQSVTGEWRSITYKSIELERIFTEHDCQTDGHVMKEATCTAPKTCYVCGITEGEPADHTWKDASCTEPKTCSVCGATEGEPAGHTWKDATCTEPKTCSVCGATEGEAVGHAWNDATCLVPKTCSVCGATEGGLGNHVDANADYKCDNCEANLCTDHTWKDATCTESKICTTCGATEGEPAGHSWADATCTTPKTCSVCGATEGEPAGHTWKDATCTEPKTCSVCGATEGEPAGHSWKNATCTEPKTCSVCGATEGEPAGHSWKNATCTEPKTCSVCGATEGAPAGHSWADATCTAPKTCSICGATEGKILAHTDADKDLVCDVCTDNMIVWDMNKVADASQWYCAQAYTEVRPTRTYSEITEAGFTAYYGHQNAWKGIILKNVEIDIAKLSGLLSFTYNTKDLTFTEYRIHVLTDKGGDLGSNTSGTPSNYYVAVKIADIAQSTAWTRTENADGTVTVTFDLKTLPYFAEGTVLKGMDIVTVAQTVTGEWRSITYKSIELAKEKNACQANGHTWVDATCTEPKTCSVCGTTEGNRLAHTDADKDHTCDVCTSGLTVWYMSKEEDASQWYCAQAYTEVRPTRTYSEITEAGFTAYYGHKNAWKGIILKNVEIDIANLSGLLSFTYDTKDLTFTEYRIHVLTDKGGDLGSNTSGTPSNYYVAVEIADIAQSTAWTRTENADGTVTVTFDLKTLPYFAEGTVLMGMDIVTVAETVTGEWRSITYKSIEIH